MSQEEKDLGCAAGCSSCAGCGHDHEHAMPMGFNPIITLTDEEGKDVKFQILDVIVLEDGSEFLVVAEAGKEEEEDIEVTILAIKEEEGEEVYDTVTDEALAEKVFNEFVKQQEEEETEIEEIEIEEEK